MPKIPHLVIYDIHSAKIRSKMAEACTDKGLERIQFSAFRGYLTRLQRRELLKRLKTLFENTSGRIFLLPICREDWRRAEALEKESDKLAPHKPSRETILRF